MNNVRRYTPQDSLVDLINDNYSILPVLSRFSIPLGFENRRIADVCTDAGIVFILLTVRFREHWKKGWKKYE